MRQCPQQLRNGLLLASRLAPNHNGNRYLLANDSRLAESFESQDIKISFQGGEAADVQHFLLAAVEAIEPQDGYCRYKPMSLIAYMAPYSNSPPKARPTQKYWTALISRPHLHSCSNTTST